MLLHILRRYIHAQRHVLKAMIEWRGDYRRREKHYKLKHVRLHAHGGEVTMNLGR